MEYGATVLDSPEAALNLLIEGNARYAVNAASS